jgi:hypothetical protein
MFGIEETRVASPDAALMLSTPVRFDAGLIARLLAQTDTINAHLASLLCRLDDDVEVSIGAIKDCAEKLHSVRQAEALWLYPVIARSVEFDVKARFQLAQLRLAMLALARRVLRRCDDLIQALRSEGQVAPAAQRMTDAWSEYLQRNQHEIYPLYELAGRRRATAATARAA